MNDPYESPCCKAKLVYAITRDAYVCRECQKPYSVLSVKQDRILDDISKSHEINREEAIK